MLVSSEMTLSNASFITQEINCHSWASLVFTIYMCSHSSAHLKVQSIRGIKIESFVILEHTRQDFVVVQVLVVLKLYKSWKELLLFMNYLLKLLPKLVKERKWNKDLHSARLVHQPWWSLDGNQGKLDQLRHGKQVGQLGS